MPTRQKLHEQMMGEVLAGIVRGEYPEGSRLPKETALAETHEVSRYVARECIHALVDRGVLRVKHGVGQTVAPREEWQLFDRELLQAMLAGPEASDVSSEIEECRRIVDDGLARAPGNRFLRHIAAALERAASD